jgi:hypothetical protein
MNAPVHPGLDSITGWSCVILASGIAVACLAFVVGHRFLSPPKVKAPRAASPEQGDVFLYGSQRERRAAPRRRGNSIEVYLAQSPDEEKIPAWVVDRSVGGLCLTVEAPVEQGSLWQVRPRKAPDQAPWTPIEVCTCRQERGTFEVGCRFIQTPPWNVMLLFG